MERSFLIFGVWKGGSLSMIRNGIGNTENATEEQLGIKYLFSLRQNLGAVFLQYLLQSSMAEKKVIELIIA